MAEIDQYTGRRLFHVVVLVAAAVSFVGFFVGTRSHGDPGGYHAEAPQKAFDDGDEDGIRRAPSYRDEARNPRNANRHWKASLAALSERPALDPDAGDWEPATPEERAQAVAARAEGRAYDGAPPTIPHPVDQRGKLACMSCHGEGLEIAGKLAPPVSHEPFTNCTQCHVVRDGSMPFAELDPDAFPLENDFVGMASAGHGPRAWPRVDYPDDGVGPPQIPHTTQMREECGSCHGVRALPGLQTSHPWRTSCTQCHAPSAELDRRPLDLRLVGQPYAPTLAP